jgi:hypothetical protein
MKTRKKKHLIRFCKTGYQGSRGLQINNLQQFLGSKIRSGSGSPLTRTSTPQGSSGYAPVLLLIARRQTCCKLLI